ncbi:MAG: extracellular solute-binding protein [Clostridia bacterium]|nr:extracellular solute-binding protein [Clostridia bacterium]
MKKLLALLLCVMLVIPSALALADDNVTITLWTYPIGDWTKDDVVKSLLADFNAAHPEITVNVQFLDYQSGDDQVTSAIEAGTTPDIIFEGPERLVANWGAKGKMLALNDLFEEEKGKEIYESVASSCKGSDGNYYEYPLCMTTHCMVINKKAFEAADAMQYINEETRTWTTEGFEAACRALTEAGFTPVTGIVYCGGQGGDQGTRALVYNLYSGRFTNEDFTVYTMDSEENVKGLQKLYDMVQEGILAVDPGIVAGDAISLFCNGTASMCFCWNAALAGNNKDNLAENVEPYQVAFPSDDGVPTLDGGIWGFGIFDNGDDAKAAAAKEFIRFMCNDDTQAPKSVYATGYFATRPIGDIYTGTEKEAFAAYDLFSPYFGGYYQIAPNWAEQRTAWWNLLQRVFATGNVADEVAVYISESNLQ